MAAHGRTVTRAEQAERERDALRAQLEERDAELAGYRDQAGQAPDGGDDTTTTDDGAAETPDGTDDFQPFEPPTPSRHNESRTARAKQEPTTAELRSQLDRMVGKTSRPEPWADLD